MLRQHLLAVSVVTLSLTSTFAQVQSTKSPKSKDPKAQNVEMDSEAAQRRAVAISLVTTLADEARSFKDQTRRARVQARAADVLWDVDPSRSQELFRRAWDAAVIVDEEAAKARAEQLKQASSGGTVTIRSGADLRTEVLRLVAKRDRKLGEEFLKILDEASAKEREETSDAIRRSGLEQQLGNSKRLQLARRLLQDGEVARAMEFAAPALDRVNIDTIFFLSALREKNAQAADAAFNNILANVARDPSADPNTVSGLSSYVFTPFLYVTFTPDGGANQSRGRGPTPAPDLPPALRTSFLRLAAQILMQPSPAPEQDITSSGRLGKYLIIKRLLPIYEQYEAELAAALRTQLTALASYVPNEFQQGPNRSVTVGLQPDSEGDPYERMQQRLDRASNTDLRDAIYADYAVALTDKGDPRARDLVDKIENAEMRKKVNAYTDFQLTQLAMRNKDGTEIAKLARTGELTSIQKVWAFTTAAKLVAGSERARASDLLEEALAESRRISGGNPDRARALTAVAAGFGEIDPVRSWETLNEVIKAANGADDFTGEDGQISARLQTAQMVVATGASAEDFDLLAVFRVLSRADLLRAIQVAKGFTGEAPRAVATLAIARSVLEKQPQVASAPN